MSLRMIVVLIIGLLAAQSTTAAPVIQPRQRLYGLSACEAASTSDSLSRIPSSEDFAAAVQAGPGLVWQIVPGQWPTDFTVKRLDPDGDGEQLRFEAVDPLMDAARLTGANVTPVFEQADLALLGYTSVDQQEPSPRWKFLSALAEKYGEKPSGNPDLPPVPGISHWTMQINIFATPQGPRPIDAQQIVLDALALSSGGARANIVADIGVLSSDITDEQRAMLTEFSRGALRSTLVGLSAGYSPDAPDMAANVKVLEAIKAATYLMPLSIQRMQPTQNFIDAAGKTSDADEWSAEKTTAAYVTALQAWCAANMTRGAVYFEQFPSSETLAMRPAELSPRLLAAGRLSNVLNPFIHSSTQQEGDVWQITFSHDTQPDSYLFFHDWFPKTQVDPQAQVGIEYLARIPGETYRVTPLVEDAQWSGPRTMKATKEGLSLMLGRSPLFVEVDDPGQPRPVPLGLTERQYRSVRRRDEPTTRALINDARKQ